MHAGAVNEVDQSVLQRTINGSAAVGEKRSMEDTAGSRMSRRHRINKLVISAQKNQTYQCVTSHL